MSSLIELIHDSSFSTLLRQSIWLYPLINAGHIIGLGLLIGSIVPLDLRLLGVWRTVPVSFFVRVLAPVSASGLALAIACGALLFITRPADYTTSVLFISKMCLLVLGLANAASLRKNPAWQNTLASNHISSRIRMHSIMSLIIWISVIIIGRLIGYR